MTDYELAKGDICLYYSSTGNGSAVLVEVIDQVNRGISEIKCLQVFNDNSGNGWFEYMLRTGHTMNASNKYLHKLVY